MLLCGLKSMLESFLDCGSFGRPRTLKDAVLLLERRSERLFSSCL